MSLRIVVCGARNPSDGQTEPGGDAGPFIISERQPLSPTYVQVLVFLAANQWFRIRVVFFLEMIRKIFQLERELFSRITSAQTGGRIAPFPFRKMKQSA